MKRRRTILLVLAVAFVGAVALMLVRREKAAREASYQGKPIRDWAAQLHPQSDPRGANEALTVFHELGSNAVPDLRRMLNRREPIYEDALVKNGRLIPRPIRPFLFEKVKPGQATNQRIAAARALGVIGIEAQAAIPDLVRGMGSPSLALRVVCAQSLARMEHSGILALSSTLTNTNSAIRFAASHALGDAGTNAALALPMLFECVLDPDPMVRGVTVNSLRKIGPPALPLVLHHLADTDSARRDASILALKTMNTPPQSLMNALLQFATNTSPALRQQSHEALRLLQLNYPRVTATRMLALQDPEPAVRSAALAGLRQNAPWTNFVQFNAITARMLGLDEPLLTNLVSQLQVLLNDSNEQVRITAQAALGDMEAAALADGP